MTSAPFIPPYAPVNAPSPLRDGAAPLLGFALLAALCQEVGGWRYALLAGIGLFAGLALYHASFGFTAAWRRFLQERKGVGLRAQLLMIALTSAVFLPLLALDDVFGRPVSGFVFPIGVALITGAFLFGLGMQIGGGCASGTLFTVGGGSARMVITLVFFIVGSTLTTAYSDLWFAWPKFDAISLVDELGWPGALGAQLAVLALLYVGVQSAEKRRFGTLVPLMSPKTQWITGPWAVLIGALALAAVNIAVLLTIGRPWGVTSAFALWGSKITALFGGHPETWPYWAGQRPVLQQSIFTDPTTVMNFGIMIGALLAASIAGKFAPVFALPLRSVLAAVLGGVLLGIGARLGTGCNIGAFFSGIASGSLHGWVWLIFAFAGNMVGVKLRPLFKLE